MMIKIPKSDGIPQIPQFVMRLCWDSEDSKEMAETPKIGVRSRACARVAQWVASAYAYVSVHEFGRVYMRAYVRACDRGCGRVCEFMCPHFDFFIWTSDVILSNMSSSGNPIYMTDIIGLISLRSGTH